LKAYIWTSASFCSGLFKSAGNPRSVLEAISRSRDAGGAVSAMVIRVLSLKVAGHTLHSFRLPQSKNIILGRQTVVLDGTPLSER
jgi:hypothetical protein